MDQDELMRERFMKFQNIQQQMEQMSSQAQLLNEKNAELDITIHALQELSKTEVDNEILAPLADGIFLKTTLKDNQKLIVNVGSGVTVEKTIPEVIGLLEQQKEELSLQVIQVEAIMQELNTHAVRIYKEIEQLNEETSRSSK